MKDDEFVPDKSRFKNGVGAYITQGLFFELALQEKQFAVYTLKDADHEVDGVVYTSLRRLYLECNDPTEYVFATKYLWGWDHWQRLLGNQMILEEVVKWRDELEVKLRAEAVKAIIDMSGDSFAAAKWAADGHWNVKRGRPTKEEAKRQRDIRDKVVRGVDSDASRIMHLVPKKEAK